MTDQSSFFESSAWLLESLSPVASSMASTDSIPVLAPLRPERRLLPNHISARAKALAYCARIDHVRIRTTEKIDGHTNYVMQIFYQRAASNIPTVQRSLDLETVETVFPAAERRQRFNAFASLRHEMYYQANAGHGSRLCEFCASMAKLLSDGPMLPRLRMKLFQGNDAVSEALEGFVNAVLTLTKQKLHMSVSGKLCDGQQEIPMLLERFLMHSTDEGNVDLMKGQRRRKATSLSVLDSR